MKKLLLLACVVLAPGALATAAPAAPPSAPVASALPMPPPGMPLPPNFQPPMPPSFGAQRQLDSTSSAHAEGSLVEVAGFAFALLIVLTMLAFRHSEERDRQETIRKIVEKGGEIPKELLSRREALAEADPGRQLRRGILFLATGIGVALCLVSFHIRGWGVGALLACIGVGLLVSAKLEKK